MENIGKLEVLNGKNQSVIESGLNPNFYEIFAKRTENPNSMGKVYRPGELIVNKIPSAPGRIYEGKYII